jgi:hypothetical protein
MPSRIILTDHEKQAIRFLADQYAKGVRSVAVSDFKGFDFSAGVVLGRLASLGLLEYGSSRKSVQFEISSKVVGVASELESGESDPPV